jgi:catechol-2,3-dioxygenase
VTATPESEEVALPISAGICELVLETSEPEELARFYEGLGLTRLSTDDDRIWLAAGSSSRLGLWSPGEKEFGDRGGSHVHFALSLESGTIERVAAGLGGRGLEVEGPVEHEGGDRSLYFYDPEGNRVELWDFFEDGAGAERGVQPLAD